jgi:hypothetical protein
MASVEEHARQLLALADDVPHAQLDAVIEALESWRLKASVILGPTQANDLITAEVASAITACAQVHQALSIVQQAAREHAQRYLGGGN